MKFLGTVVDRITAEPLPASRKSLSSLNNISLRYNEETKKLRKLVRNKLTRKQEQCTCYFC
jgi:hypothetical protein